MNKTIIGFIKKELRQSLRDKRMKFMIFGVPIVQLLLFGFALSTDVKNIKLALKSKPSDVIARNIYDKAIHSGWFVPAGTSGNDPYEWLKKGKAEAVLISPPGNVACNIASGKGKMQLLVDATNSIRARQIENYILNIIKNATFPKKSGNFKIEKRVLYNPEMKSAFYQVPAVMAMVICVITVILTAMSITKEKETGTFETIISAPVEDWEILVGKTLPYLLLGFAVVPIMILVAVSVFRVPMRGSLVHFLLTSLIFIFTTVSVGTAISTFSETQQQAMMGSFLFLFPALLLSGLIFPVENMPFWAKFVAYADPLYYFMKTTRNIMLKGGDLSVVTTNSFFLFLIGTSVFLLAVKRFKQKLG